MRRNPLIAVCPAGLRLLPTAPLQGRSLRTISLRSWAPWRAGATLRSYAPLTGELSARRHWCAMIEPSPGNSVKGGWAHRNTGRKRLRPVTTLDDYNNERLAIAFAVPPPSMLARVAWQLRGGAAAPPGVCKAVAAFATPEVAPPGPLQARRLTQVGRALRLRECTSPQASALSAGRLLRVSGRFTAVAQRFSTRLLASQYKLCLAGHRGKLGDGPLTPLRVWRIACRPRHPRLVSGVCRHRPAPLGSAAPHLGE